MSLRGLLSLIHSNLRGMRGLGDEYATMDPGHGGAPLPPPAPIYVPPRSIPGASTAPRAEVVTITPDMRAAYEAARAPNITIRRRDEPLSESQLWLIQKQMKERQEFQRRLEEASKSAEEKYWDSVRSERDERRRQSELLARLRAESAAQRAQRVEREAIQSLRTVPGADRPQDSFEAAWETSQRAMRRPAPKATYRPAPAAEMTPAQRRRIDKLLEDPKFFENLEKNLGLKISDPLMRSAFKFAAGSEAVSSYLLNEIEKRSGIKDRDKQIDMIEAGVSGGIGAVMSVGAKDTIDGLRSAFDFGSFDLGGTLRSGWQSVASASADVGSAATGIVGKATSWAVRKRMQVAAWAGEGVAKSLDSAMGIADRKIETPAQAHDAAWSLRFNLRNLLNAAKARGYTPSGDESGYGEKIWRLSSEAANTRDDPAAKRRAVEAARELQKLAKDLARDVGAMAERAVAGTPASAKTAPATPTPVQVSRVRAEMQRLRAEEDRDGLVPGTLATPEQAAARAGVPVSVARDILAGRVTATPTPPARPAPPIRTPRRVPSAPPTPVPIPRTVVESATDTLRSISAVSTPSTASQEAEALARWFNDPAAPMR